MKTLKTHAKVKFFPAALAAMAFASLTPSAVSVEYTDTFEWTAVYDASVMPMDPGSVQYNDGTTGAFHEGPPPNEDNTHNLNAELRDGVLSIDSVTRGEFRLDAGQEGRFVLNTDTGYTAEFRARLIRSVNLTTDPWNINGACVQLNDGRAGQRGTVHLGFFTHPVSGLNYARARTTTFSPAVPIGTDFHTYTFVVDGSGASLYFNGYFLATLPRWLATDRPEVWLGTIQAGGNHVAHFEVDYLKIYDGGAVHPVDIGPWIPPAITGLIEPLPEIVGFGRENGDFALSFNTMIGGNYVVEARDDLAQGSPNEPLVRVIGTGEVTTSRDSMAGVDRRFYRVAREPEEIVYEESFEWDLRYEGNDDPFSSDAIQYKDGTTGGFTGFREVAGKYRNKDGILWMEMPVGQTLGGAFEVSAGDWNRFLVDADTGYTVEYRARVDHSLHYGAAFLEINTWDGQHFAGIGLVTAGGENRVRLQSGAGVVVTDHPVGTGFNTYTLVGDRNLLTLFINGVEVASTSEIIGASRSILRFGSTTGNTNTSRHDVDYIRVYTGGAVRPVSPLED